MVAASVAAAAEVAAAEGHARGTRVAVRQGTRVSVDTFRVLQALSYVVQCLQGRYLDKTLSSLFNGVLHALRLYMRHFYDQTAKR